MKGSENVLTSKRYNREDVIAPYNHYEPEVELIDNGGGLEFRTRFTNIVSADFDLKFNVIHLM